MKTCLDVNLIREAVQNFSARFVPRQAFPAMPVLFIGFRYEKADHPITPSLFPNSISMAARSEISIAAPRACRSAAREITRGLCSFCWHLNRQPSRNFPELYQLPQTRPRT